MSVKVKQKIKIWLIGILAVCFLLSSAGVLSTASMQHAVGAGGINSDTENIEQSAVTEKTYNGMKYWDFSFTGSNATTGQSTIAGSVQSVTLPVGKYKLEVWGAEGGGYDLTGISDIGNGGKGGYSVGVYKVTGSSQTLYVGVGGHGLGAEGTNIYAAGGWNGGASGHSSTTSEPGGGGGGATHIATTNRGELRNYASYKSEVLIVAGGGGGGGEDAADPYGHGGGVSGVDGIRRNNTTASANTSVTHGNQTSAGEGGGFGYGGSSNGGDGGGGGGGWYGGGTLQNVSSSSTDTQGGGGGSGYVGNSLLISDSYTFNGSTVQVNKQTIDGGQSFPNTANLSASVTNETGHSGHGYARITQLNSPPRNNGTEPTSSLNRGATVTHNLNTIAQDTDVNNGTNDTFRFSTASGQDGVFLASNNTSASSYLGWSYTNKANYNNNTSAAPSITVYPKYYFTTTRFYFYAQDNWGYADKIYFNVGVNDQGVTRTADWANGAQPKGAYKATGSSGAYTKGAARDDVAWRMPTSADLSNYGTTGQVANEVQTLFLSKSISRGSDGTAEKVMIRVEDLYRDDDQSTATGATKDNVLIKGATKHNTSDGTYNIATGIDSNGVAGSYYDYLVIEPNPGTTNGGQYSSIIVTTVSRENGGGNRTVDRDTFRIVFKVDNTRPVLKADNAVRVKAGQSVKVALTSIANDLDGNAMTLHSTDPVVVPSYEYVQVDKYGTLVDSTVTGNYNKSASGTKVTQSEINSVTGDTIKVLKTGMLQLSGYETGFDPNLVVKSGAIVATNNTYATYSISADKREITITGVHASRSQYKATRGSSTGHFYILLHIVDAGETEDAGIWLPLAIQVDNTAPVATTSGQKAYELGVGGALYFSPFMLTEDVSASGATTTQAKIYTDANKTNRINTTYTFCSDVDDFTNAANEKNAFTYFYRSGGTENQLDNQGITNYLNLETATLYAAKALFAKLSAGERTLLHVQDAANGMCSFDGVKVTGVRTTTGKYLEIPLTVTDTMDAEAKVTQTLSFKVTNREGNARVTGDDTADTSAANAYLAQTLDGNNSKAEWVYEAPSKAKDKTKKTWLVKYNVHNNARIVLTPYQLVKDNDVYLTTKNASDKYVTNKDPDIAANRTRQEFDENRNALTNDGARELYATPNSVKTTEGAERIQLGYDSLRFIFQEGEIASGFGYGASGYMTAYTNDGQVASGTFPYLRLELSRRTAKNTPLEFTLTVADSEVENLEYKNTIQITVQIHVNNYAPQLKDSAKLQRLTATATGATLEGSEARALYHTLELPISELATDPDFVDTSNLRFYTNEVEVYTLGGADGKTHQSLTGYITASITSGTGNNVGREVLRLEGLSSTQQLEKGLWVGFTVTDGYDDSEDSRSNLSIQVEVYNSKPIMATDTKFEKTGEVTLASGAVAKANVWDISPQNPNNVADRFSTRYIASSNAVYTYLASGEKVTATDNKKTDSTHVTQLIADADGRQHALFTSVTPSKVYNSEGKYLTVETLYYTVEANGTVTPIAADGIVDTDKKQIKEKTDDGKAIHWAIAVTPSANFEIGNAVELTVRVRDNFEDGGDTDGEASAYSGERGSAATAVVNGVADYTVYMKLGSIGFVNNIASYADGYYVYKATGDDTGTQYYPYTHDHTSGGTLNADHFEYRTVEIAARGTNDQSPETYVPISYLALPADVQPENNTRYVSFNSWYYNGVTGNPKGAEALKDITLTDGFGHTYTGTALANNPYIGIEPTFSATAFEGSAYLNKLLYYVDTADKEVKPIRSTEGSTTKGILYEDRIGLKIVKKNLRSSRKLTLTVRLAQYKQAGDTYIHDTYTDGTNRQIVQDVKFELTVENDLLTVTQASGNGGTHTVTTAGNNTAVESINNAIELRGNAGSETGGILTKDMTVADGDMQIRLTDDANASPSATDKHVYLKYARTRDYDAGDGTFRENAYFHARFSTGQLTEEDVNKILQLETNDSKTTVASFLGLTESAVDSKTYTLESINAQLNPGYDKFFTVIPSSADSSYLTIRPVRKTALNSSDTTAGNAYRLKYNATHGMWYYPFKALVYDDYRGTGWEESAYRLIQINVYIANSAPQVSTTTVIGGVKTFNVSLQKGGESTYEIPYLMTDADMTIDRETQRFKASYSDPFDTLTLDTPKEDAANRTVSGVKVVEGGTVTVSGSNLVCTPTGDIVTMTVESDGRIRFKADNRGKATFTVRFVDSAGGESEDLNFNVEVTNKSPTIHVSESSTVTSTLSGGITLTAGQYFTVVTTPYDAFDDGPTTSNSIKYFHAFASGTESQKAFYNLYQNLTEENMRRNDGSHCIRQDATAQGVGEMQDRGYVALADDDTPWQLRFGGYSLSANALAADGKTQAINVLPIGAMAAEDTTGPSDYSLGYKIVAVSACNNAEIRFTILDGEGQSVTAALKVTVTSAKPALRTDVADQTLTRDDNGNAVEWTLKSTNSNPPVFTIELYQGTQVAVNPTRLVVDTDVNETLSVRVPASGSIFTINNNSTNADEYISLTSYGTRFVIFANNVHNGQAYSTVGFDVEDSSGQQDNAVRVTLHVLVKPQNITVANAMAVKTVVSVKDYTLEPTADTYALFTDAENSGALFTDPDVTANTVNYDMDVYALFDEEGLPQSAAEIESRRLIHYSGGVLQIENNAYATLMQRYFTPNVVDGGRTLAFIPIKATTEVSGLGLYVTVHKRITYTASETETFETSASARLTVRVENSAVEAVGNTTLNFGGKQEGNPYLVADMAVGETLEYAVQNGTRTDLGLFKDVDGDTLTVRGDEIRVLDEYTLTLTNGSTTYTTTNGWKADAAKGLETAYTASVTNGNVAIRINRRTTPPEGGKGILLLEVTARDGSTRATTVIVIRIVNSAPTFTEYNGRNYTVAYGDLNDAGSMQGYIAELTLESGKSVEMSLSDFVHDNDFVGNNYLTEQFTFSYVTGAEVYGIVAINNKPNVEHLIYAETDTQKRNPLFKVQVSDENNAKLVITCLTGMRTQVGEIWTNITDGSGAQTREPLVIRLITTNSAPYILEDAETTVKFMGKEDGVAESRTLHILDYIGDGNANDLLEPNESTTYLRILGLETDPVEKYITAGSADEKDDTSGMIAVCRIADEYSRTILIRPITGRYGSQTLRLYVTDDGGRLLADAKTVMLELTVQVSKDVSVIRLNDIDSLPWKTTSDEITPASLLNDGTEEYSLGYEIERLTLEDSARGRLSIITEEDDAGKKHWYIRADAYATDAPQLVYVFFNVAGEVQPTAKAFRVTVTENRDPFKKDPFVSTVQLLRKDLDETYVKRYSVYDIFGDYEGDPLKMANVRSSEPLIIDAGLEDDGKTLVLTFKARGKVDVTLDVSDITDRANRVTLTFESPDLSKVNAFTGLFITMRSNPVLYICLIGGLLLLLIILIIIIAVVRRKKRMQAEVEALLVSEMELEEQMMRLAAAQNMMNGYALPPVTPTSDPNLGLNAATPPPNAALGLNAPSSKPPQSPDDFDQF